MPYYFRISSGFILRKINRKTLKFGKCQLRFDLWKYIVFRLTEQSIRRKKRIVIK